ncbi:FAD-dependent oxidoreductase [Pseudorhizobium endolithicum]|uniref:FAD-dependent oxidoreductase n=2 Tax=Pseudorhizobium endolithicum TaxID=1191678 RepID=A0ABM8PMC8_9HYPH|nr:FAD-dependent oxidoreductase [Pseudorhizobium endolithicum]
MTATDLRTRIGSVAGQAFEVAVVGGGINGTAVARQLAHEGRSVLLVEKEDFGAGSSSRSSRIMHCGLNYLAEVLHAKGPGAKLRNLRLARRMMIERARLWRDLPGRLIARPFVIPIRAEDAVRPWAYDLAFRALRALGGYGVPIDYRRFAGQSLQDHPLRPFFSDDLVGLVSFSELVFEWPEAVCHDYARDAAALGAKVLNYVALADVTRETGGWRLSLVDMLTPGVTSSVSARHVVNMTGIASDRINARAASAGLTGFPSRTVTPNKGCHAAMRLPEPFRGMGILRRNELGHLFLAVPWRDYHIVGPTETAVVGDPPPPRAEESDVAALVAAAAENIPGAHIDHDDVLYHWGGYRPAGYSADNLRGQWLRTIYAPDDTVQDGGAWLSMAWGRLADHRITAEEVAKLIAARSGRNAYPRSTERLPPLAPRRADERDFIAGPLGPATLADVMFGRLGLGWSADLGRSEMRRVADVMAEANGTSADKLVLDYEALLRKEFGATS